MPNGCFIPSTNVNRSSATPSLFASRSTMILPARASERNTSPFGASASQRGSRKSPSANVSTEKPGGIVNCAPAGRGTTRGGLTASSAGFGGGRSEGLMLYCRKACALTDTASAQTRIVVASPCSLWLICDLESTLHHEQDCPCGARGSVDYPISVGNPNVGNMGVREFATNLRVISKPRIYTEKHGSDFLFRSVFVRVDLWLNSYGGRFII